MSRLLNYRKLLLSAVVIAFVTSLVFASTGAFFNDTETSTGNTFTAGAIDLKVDSESHYNGMVCTLTDQGYLWLFPGGRANQPDPENAPNLWGTPCDGSWQETDLGPTNTFFNFGDLKPGDSGENTLSLHVYNNDAYACAIIDNMQNNDNGCNEPELNAEQDAYGQGSETCGDPGVGEGELANEIHFFAWADNGAGENGVPGDNIWNGDEPMLFSNTEGPASDVLNGVVYPLYTPSLNNGAVLHGTTTEYIGMYWCYGDINVDTNAHTLSCDGSGATNITQSDSLSADISFYVEQARNNENFQCPSLPTS